MASQYKKMNIKNIGIDPFSPVVVSINKEHGAVLYKWYNHIVVFHLKSKTNIKNINALIGKQKIKNREKVFDRFKKGNLPNRVKVYKYQKGQYYTTRFIEGKYLSDYPVNLKVWMNYSGS